MNYSEDRLPGPLAILNKLVLYNPDQINKKMKMEDEHRKRSPKFGCRHMNTDDRYLLPVSENSADCGQPPGQEETIRVIIVEPWTPPKIMWIRNTLHAKQHIVGGFIEVVYPFADSAAMILNEEGKLIGLPLNRNIGTDIIAGTFIISGIDEYSASFVSLTDQQVKHYATMFRTVEIYLDPAVFLM